MKNFWLILFLAAMVVYGYAHVNNLLWLEHVSKPIGIPLFLSYYVVLAKKINSQFLVGLFFAFSSALLFMGTSDLLFFLGVACSLIFVLINIAIITEIAGLINLKKFYKIAILFVLFLVVLLYFIFRNEGEEVVLFYIFGTVVALYASFSFYLFKAKPTKLSLLNFIGVLFFVVSSIAKGLEQVDDSKPAYKIINVTFYSLFLLFIGQSIAGLDSKKVGK